MRAALLLVLLLAGCAAPERIHVTPPPATTSTPLPPAGTIRLVTVVEGLDEPVFVLTLPDGTGRLALVEQAGRVRVAENGTLAERPYLDITERVGSGGERGLLGLAFSPTFATDGVAFVSYTDTAGDTTLSRFHVAGPDALDPASEEVFFHLRQPFGNHNGGEIAFGPDGFLYLGLGDGGSAGDPARHGQDPDSLLASMLRLDVRGAKGYTIPPGNPYAQGGGKPEVWAKGLRNPWRFSFDRETGDLWIGDVGQDAWEEIDLQPRASAGGENYGWNVDEGTHPYDAAAAPFKPVTAPVHAYAHDGRTCSVTGGYVYRGASAPALRGAYLFADYCSGQVWALRSTGSAWDASLLLESERSISSFGEDAAGEVYVVDHGGTVLRIVAA